MVLAACGAEPTPTPQPACPTEPPTAISAQATLEDAALATVTVSGAVSGEFAFELYGDQAPIATANFVALARCGFYEGIWFHRVLAGFVIQAGDPGTRGQTGDFAGLGSGGAGYGFEIEPPAEDLAYVPYSVAMANDTQTNDSQFFISLVDLTDGLQRLYTIFGQVDLGDRGRRRDRRGAGQRPARRGAAAARDDRLDRHLGSVGTASIGRVATPACVKSALLCKGNSTSETLV